LEARAILFRVDAAFHWHVWSHHVIIFSSCYFADFWVACNDRSRICTRFSVFRSSTLTVFCSRFVAFLFFVTVTVIRGYCVW
jgi:hypothetical protein